MLLPILKQSLCLTVNEDCFPLQLRNAADIDVMEETLIYRFSMMVAEVVWLWHVGWMSHSKQL